MKNPEKLCVQVHRFLDTLPTFKEPSEVSFSNGLYFLYEHGEFSTHGPSGRIVRIGNHPRSQNGLKKRLWLHYSGNKNSSVLRRYIGGAILRKNHPHHPCLQPRPGQGHWEKQGMPTCERCKPIESRVSKLLRDNFRFRCVEIVNQDLRNTLEKKLVATISLCPICKPSGSWLGRFACSESVKTSGVWNSNYVFDHKLILSVIELETLGKLIRSTSKLL